MSLAALGYQSLCVLNGGGDLSLLGHLDRLILDHLHLAILIRLCAALFPHEFITTGVQLIDLPRVHCCVVDSLRGVLRDGVR